MLQIITLPKLGESILEATILKIRVTVGQKVSADDTLLEFATDKTDTELPSDFNGIVSEIFIKEDDTVPIGANLLSIETVATVGSETDKPKALSVIAVQAHPPSIQTIAKETSAEPIAPTLVNAGVFMKKVSPVARKIAKSFDLNIDEVIRSVPEERRITKKDVDNFIKKRLHNMPMAGNIALPPLEDFSKFGKIEFEDLNPVGKATARHLAQVWSSVPHAWMLEKADITTLARHREEAKMSMPNLSWTALYIKVIVGMLKQFPRCNASFDAASGRIVFKKYYHIGVAMNTPRGLIVPVVRDADHKSLAEIGDELAGFPQKANGEGKNFSPDDFAGHSFSISNVGMFGSTGILPIVHAPDSAILGLTAAKKEVVWDEITQQPVPRLLLPMTLGFDHRVVNGAEASQFLTAFKKMLEGPILGVF